MRFASLLAAALAALLLFAACGGDDDGDGGPAANQDELAEAMLLVLGDLPPSEEWEHTPPDAEDEDDPNPFDSCDSEDEGIIGRADGGDFSRGAFSEISEDIRIFESTDLLKSSLDDIEQQAECMADIVAGGALDTDAAAFSGFTMERIDYRDFGDESRAYRIEMTVTDLDPEDPLEPFPIFLDMIFVAVDTVGMRIAAIDAGSPYDGDESSRIVGLAEEKVRDVLAANPIEGD